MASGPANNSTWATPPQIANSWDQFVNSLVPPLADFQTALRDVSIDSPKYVEDPRSPEGITAIQLAKFLASETVTIYVGSNRKEFKLSKDLLCYVSPFFKAAFEGEFKEGKEQTMELLEDDVEAFTHVVSYIYRGTFGSLDDPFKYQTECYRCSSKLSTSIYLLELSERLQILGMKDAALFDIAMVLRHSDTTKPTFEDVELAFDLLPAASKAIDVIVEYVAADFLRAGSKLSIDLIKTWKFEPLMNSIEGFDMLLLFTVKKLSVRRLEHEHQKHGDCAGWQNCQANVDAGASWPPVYQHPHF